MVGRRKYILELTEAQYDIIAMCIEVVHRISVGQVEELNEILPENIGRELLDRIKEQAFPELSLNQSYKWCGGHPNESISYLQAATYAIYREMLHFNAVHDGYDNVYQSPTLRCDGIDIPKITLIDENDGNSEKQEQPVLPGIKDPGIPGKDFIPVEWVDACDKYGKWKIVKQEQPEVDLEVEIKDWCNKAITGYDPIYTGSSLKYSMLPNCARHFYELGLNARKEESK